MAPEQARGEVETIGPRTDVYSLGAVLRFMLQDFTRAPKALQAISRKAMGEDADLRYASVEELGKDISRYLDGMPVSAYPEGAARRLWRWVSRNRAWILLILAYLVMRAVFILWRAR